MIRMRSLVAVLVCTAPALPVPAQMPPPPPAGVAPAKKLRAMTRIDPGPGWAPVTTP